MDASEPSLLAEWRPGRYGSIWSSQGRGDLWAQTPALANRLRLGAEGTVAGTTSPGGGWTAAQARDVPPRLARLAGFTTGLVFVQLVLGALMRHMGAGLAIPDFPLAFGRLVPPLATPYITVHFAHRVGALAVAAAVAMTVGAVLRERAAGLWLRRPAFLAAGLVLVQLTLGALVIWSGRAVLPTTTHLVVGAALLATCLVLALRAGRVAAPRTAEAAALRVRRQALA